MIFKQNIVTLTGLPSYLTKYNNVPMLEFDPYNLNDFKTKLPALMPSFRESIETKKIKHLNDSATDAILKGLAVVGGIALLSGFVGGLFGSSKK